MWVQSNWFVGAAEGSQTNYCFSLRPLSVTKFDKTKAAPSNSNKVRGESNLALEDGTTAIDKTSHYRKLAYLNEDGPENSEDSWDGSIKNLDRWGYTWPTSYAFNRVVYTTGAAFPDGGFFASDLTVRVRNDFKWTEVSDLAVDPTYPYDASANPTKVYTFTFDEVVGDGIEIIGVPGGTASFTSISELEVYGSKA